MQRGPHTDHVEGAAHLRSRDNQVSPRLPRHKSRRGETYLTDKTPARLQQAMHAPDDLGRVALHPVQRRVREHGVELSVALQAVKVVPVTVDPADGVSDGRRERRCVGLRASEQVGGGVEADDGAAREDGGQERVERELARTATEVEDVLLCHARSGVSFGW